MNAIEKLSWSVADAKARFSEMIDKARSNGPQTLTKNGKPIAILVSIEEWEKWTKPKESLIEFFRNSPLYDSGVEFERMDATLRDVEP
jgi:prevent-host-death family protein